VESSSKWNSPSSTDLSGETVAPISLGGAASVLIVSTDDSDVVNLSSLCDEALVVCIIKKALLVLGFNATCYDNIFFEVIAGLCGSDLDVSDVPASGNKKLGWKTLLPPKVEKSQANLVWLKNGLDAEIVQYMSMLFAAAYA
jgi:hypothetical protein